MNNINITYNIGTDGWTLSGNNVTNAVLGTKNDEGFNIITNNTPRVTVSSDGEIGINKIPQTGVTLDIGGQIYSEGGFTNPQTITNNLIIPPNSNSLLIGPDITMSGTVTIGVNSILTILP